MGTRISQYIVNAEVWEKSLCSQPNPVISQFIIMAEIDEVLVEEKTLNIRYGDIPIEKIYLGNVDITNVMH